MDLVRTTKNAEQRANPLQSLEIDVAAIHNVECAGLGEDVVEDVDVMYLSVGNADKRWDIAMQIEQSVHFHRAFVLRPAGRAQRQSRQFRNESCRWPPGCRTASQSAVLIPTRMHTRFCKDFQVLVKSAGASGRRAKHGRNDPFSQVRCRKTARVLQRSSRFGSRVAVGWEKVAASMKLRIQDNSLRFRLTRKEVMALRDGGFVEGAIRFPACRVLAYSVVSSPHTLAPTTVFADDTISVVLPEAMTQLWADGDAVELEGIHSEVSILVEKDFQCLHKPAERDPDAFPNPLGTIGESTK